MNRYKSVSLLLSMFLIVSLAAPVSASHNDSVVDFSSDDSILPEEAQVAISFAKSVVSKNVYDAKSVFSDDEQLSTEVSEAETALKDNKQNRVDYLNKYMSDEVDKTNYDVFKICMSMNGNTDKRFVEASISDNSYTDYTITSSTNKNVDTTVKLNEDQVIVVDTILEHVDEEYVDEDKKLDRSLVGYLGGKLGTDFYPDDIYNGDSSC